MAFSIGELSRRTGIPASAIRYYEEVGVLARSSREAGRRVFEDADVARLFVVAFAQEAGFTLREIRQLMTGFATGTPASTRWRTLAAAKLRELDARAARLRAMKVLLREALACGCLELEACGRLFRHARVPDTAS